MDGTCTIQVAIEIRRQAENFFFVRNTIIGMEWWEGFGGLPCPQYHFIGIFEFIFQSPFSFIGTPI